MEGIRERRFWRFMSLVLATALALTLIALPQTAQAEPASATMAELYVSPDGSDGAAGTAGEPLKTIEAARDKVRGMNGDMTGDIIVHIAGGTYQIDDTIRFEAQDSATNGYRIIYRAADGETPVVSGGVEITGWTLHDAGKNIYKAQVPEGLNFRQLYVDGAKATRARNTQPGMGDSAYYKIADVDPMNKPGGDAVVKNGALFINKSEIPAEMPLEKLVGAELHEVISWTGNVLRIAGAEEQGDKIKLTFQQPESDLMFNRPFPWIGNFYGGNDGHYPYYIDNAYELMDLAGEWYLDRDADTLYYKAEQGQDMSGAEVVAPKVETLLDVDGGSLDTPITGLSFDGLTFMYSNWTYPSDNGFVDSQESLPVVSANLKNELGVIRPSAGIHFACANNMRFENNTVKNIGNASAVDFEYGTHDDVIKNNLITNVAGNGIMIAKFMQDDGDEYHQAYNPSDKREYCDNDKILNNRLLYTGREYEGSCAIAAGYPRNLVIANNEVGYTPYTGISVGYGWTHEDNAMAGNVILRNEIYGVMANTNDGAGIYTLSKQPGSVMSENYLHSFGGSGYLNAHQAGAIYTDEQTDGYTITRNVAVSCGGHANNSQLSGNLNMYDNYFVSSLTSELQLIADAAGPQDYLNDTDNVRSHIYKADVVGDMAVLDGYFDVEAIESIVFTGPGSSEIAVPAANAEELEKTKLICKIPETAVGGPVFVRDKNGADSNKDVILATSYQTDLAIDETFDDYGVGAIEGGNALWTGDQYSSIAEAPGGVGGDNALKLTGPSSGNGATTTKQTYSTEEMQFDFYFANDETAYYGLYIRAGNDQIMLNPKYTPTVRGHIAGQNDVSGENITIDKEAWYTCKYAKDDTSTKIKVWPRGTEEPGEWALEVNARQNGAGEISLEYHSPGTGNSAYIDNVKVLAGSVPELNIPTLESISASSVITLAGKMPVLPEKVTANYSNGSALQLGVTWDYIPAEKYEQEGAEFEVKGTVKGTDIEAKCTVKVLAAAITETFERFGEGALPGDDALWKDNSPGSSEAKIAARPDGEGKALELTSWGANASVGSVSAMNAIETEFDFYFVDAPTAYEGLYMVIKDGEKYYDRISVLPAFDPSLKLERQEGESPAAGTLKAMSAQTWYTAKAVYADNQLKLKVWEKSAAEPAKWDLARTAPMEEQGFIHMEFFAMSRKSALIDNYTVRQARPEDVTASVEPGMYESAQQVVLSCATENSKIYYTTDGTEPTTADTEYTEAITVDKDMTIRAVGWVDNWATGNTSTFAYTVTIPPADKTELQDLYDEYEGLEQGTYTNASWTAFTEALSAAKTVLDDDAATQDDVDDALEALQNAVNGLVEMDQVEAVTASPAGGTYPTAQEVSLSCATQGATIYYTTNSTEPTTGSSEYTGKITVDRDMTIKAFAVKEDMTDGPVATFTYTIVDKSELQSVYDANKDKEKGNYTDESWAAFEAALENAKTMLDKQDATQQQIDGAKTTLENAVAGLTEKEEPEKADKAALQNLYDANKDKVQGNYTDESWAEFTKALDNAKAALDDENAKQEAVDAVKAALESAITGLTEKGEPGQADKAALQNLYDANKDKAQGNYTDESWAAFTKALSDVKAALDDANATQGQIDGAKAALEAAIAGLTEKGKSIVEQINEAPAGGTVVVPVNANGKVPAEALNAAKGKDVNLVTNYGSYSWTVNGKDITGTIDETGYDLTVKALKDAKLSELAGGKEILQIEIAHNGELPFKATLRLYVGTEHEGKTAHLYYHNEGKGALEYHSSSKVNDDGYATFDFTHCSKYVIVLEKLDVANGTGNGNGGGSTKPKTGDETNAVLWILIAAAAAGAIGGAGVYRLRKRN